MTRIIFFFITLHHSLNIATVISLIPLTKRSANEKKRRREERERTEEDRELDSSCVVFEK